MLVQFFDYFRKTYKAGSRRHQPAVRSSRMPQRQERFSGARTRGPDFTGFNRNATDRSGMCSVSVATPRAIGDVLSSSSSSLVMLAHYYFRSAHRQKLNYRKFLMRSSSPMGE